jgi:hypothetical protein
MTIPSASNYPLSLDDNNSLLGNPVDQVVLTLAAAMGISDTTFAVNESITAINVPTMFVFNTGEIIYVTSKNDGTKEFSCERGLSISHDAAEEIRLSVTAQYVKQLKNAIVAIETVLGLSPAGSSSTVKNRIAAIETELGANPSGAFATVVGRLDDADDRINTVVVYIKILGEATALKIVDGAMSWYVPPELAGAELINADAFVYELSTSGTPTFQINNGTNDLLSTPITIDVAESSSLTAISQAVINPSYKTVTAGMKLRFDVDAIGTGTRGLDLSLTFRI